jgi:flagellar motor component MotA
MTNEEFAKEYTKILERVLSLHKKARSEGLLAVEDLIDENKYKQRDVFELGLTLVCDGTDGEILRDILSNIVELETDKDKKTLKTIQKEAVLAMQAGLNARLLIVLLNSYVNIGIEDAMQKYKEI